MLDQIKSRVPTLHSVFVSNHDDARVGLTETLTTGHRNCEVIQHDNSGTEFGAYQAGVDRMLANFDPDWILIANDTFATHNNFGTVYRNKLIAELAQPRSSPAIIGQVVSLPRSYKLAGLRAHRWITTNLFAINRAALRALGGIIYRPELESLVVETADLSGFFLPAVDPVLRDHLEVWLFRTRPGWHWYASDSLQPANAARMARKARSILQEKNLAALLEESGAEFVDLKQLSVSHKILRKVDDKIFEFKHRWNRTWT